MLPVKFAVLPDISELTVKLFVVTLLATSTKFAVTKLPKLAFNAELMLPVKFAVLPESSKPLVKLVAFIL